VLPVNGRIYYDISNLISGIADLSTYFNADLRGHSFRVALISAYIGSKISYSESFLKNLFLAALFHDIGILFFEEKEQEKLLLQDNAGNKLVHLHAYIGYELFKNYPYFRKVAKIIREHHKNYREFLASKETIPFSSQIIFLADRIDIFVKQRLQNTGNLIDVLPKLKEKLLSESSKTFHPLIVNIFLNHFHDKEAFWFTIYTDEEFLKREVTNWLENLDFTIPLDNLLTIIDFFGYLIDFKSPFTATHSSSVAQTATHLASLLGFSSEELRKMEIAGFLHDIGKIMIPTEILEKPARLTKEEFFIMKSHVFYTYTILTRFLTDQDIIKWASYHHEKLNGNGYPFKLKGNKIPLGSRIMAVADIYTALTEDRPYKKGLNPKEALKILYDLTDNNEIDRKIVNILAHNLYSIEKTRKSAQSKALRTYNSLKSVAENFSV
jgi:putative nucleotidyltransferase with HDIG domain